MKVLQVNCVYKKGSTGKIVFDLNRCLLDEGVESIICYGRGDLVNETNVYKTCPEWYAHWNKLLSMFSGVMYGGCYYTTRKLISIIQDEKPDIVHLHCINGYFVNIYSLLNWLKNNRILTVLTLHAEFMYTGGCGYALDCNQWNTEKGCGMTECPQWKKETKSLFVDRTGKMWKMMKKAFEGFDEKELFITSVSPWLMERAANSPIMRAFQHATVLNGINTEVFHSYDQLLIRQQLGLSDEKIIFHATAYFSDEPNHIKGGTHILKLAEMFANQNIKIVVAGSYSENLTIPDNVIMLGNVSDQQKLAMLYSMADVTVLTSRKETFSMIVAESLCCGTPIVGFQAGAPEQIAIEEYSSFVEYGNIERLYSELCIFLNKKKEHEIEILAKEKYSTVTMTKGYLSIYEKLIGEEKA